MRTQPKRISDLAHFIIICILLGCNSGVALAQRVKAPAEKADAAVHTDSKPNIIFILVDDLGYGDLGSFFQNQRRKSGDRSEPWLLTPKLDTLVLNGAKLTQHYCPAPVCAPSRASLLLGVSQGHANVRDNQFDKALEDNYTLGNVMRQAGYATAVIGKWGLQGDKRWDKNGTEWPAHPLNRGFDYYLGCIRHVDGHEHYPKEGVYRGAKEVWENRTEISVGLDKCYTTDLWTAGAKKWIINHHKNNGRQPFFMYLAYDTPHMVFELPTQPYPAGGGLTGGMQWLGQSGQMINTASGEVDSWTHTDYADATYDEDKNPSTPEVPWPDTYKRYATMIRRLDDAVEDIRQLLKDLKMDSNTMIVFTSDNGPERISALPKEFGPAEPTFFDSFGPFDGIKRDCWEGGLRVPTIAYWPNHIPAGKVVSTPSSFYDWMATFCEAAGMAPPVRTDGVSLLPALTSKGKQEPPLVYVEYFEHATTPDYPEFLPEHRNRRRNQMQMVRLGNRVGVRYNIQSAADNFEIYDVVQDPEQKNNLANQNSKLQQLMKERVLQVRRPDSTAVRPYDTALVPSVKLLTAKPGLKLRSFTTNLAWIPKTDRLKPVAATTVAAPGIGMGTAANLFLFEGFIKVPSDGKYTFYVSSDHKAFLRLHEAVVIDADYGNSRQKKAGKISLQAGYHPVKIYYVAKPSTQKPSFSLEWSKNGNARAAIPADLFFN